MSEKYPGGFVTYNPPTPSQTSATGIWTLSQQEQYQQAGQWPYPGYNIQRSLRFNSADSAYLSRTPASAGNRQIWTYSAWVKLSSVSTYQGILGSTAGTPISFGFYNTGPFFMTVSGVGVGETSAVFRDPSAWYHVVIKFDTTQATSANRVLVYINNVNYPLNTTLVSQNTNYEINNASAQNIGLTGVSGGTTYLSGYLTEVNFIDGQALNPSSFAETNAETGAWQPKAYTGTYGTNGFYLNFSDNSNTTPATLGKDYSGNGNNWSPINFSVTAGSGNDSLVDVPTSFGNDTGLGGQVRGNYETWNPLNALGMTASNGNLDAFMPSGGGGTAWNIRGSLAVSSGKWYFECTIGTISGTGGPLLGVCRPSLSVATYMVNTGSEWLYYGFNGNKYNSTSSSYGSTWGSGDVIGVALDMDAGTITFYKNGTSQGVAFTNLAGNTVAPAISTDQASNSYTVATNFGQRAWLYTPPAGFRALCTQNLPTPTIGATSTTLATKYFNPVLYTGNASARSITGVGFQPDFVWAKSRSGVYNNVLDDAVRGAGLTLQSDSTAVEVNEGSSGLTAFTSDGFNIGGSSGGWNANTVTYVAWNWRASNATAVTNTAGTITSTVSANTTSGFSIVTYTGTGVNATVGHGLGVAPNWIIVKRRNVSEAWGVRSNQLTGNNYSLLLNSTAAESSSYSPPIWGTASPTSTVFSIGTSTASNQSTGTYVAYCFAPVEGYSAMGSYTGNGSTDGPFIYCGFRPSFVMVKCSSNAGTDWMITDTSRSPQNACSNLLFPNLSDAENTGSGNIAMDIVSNGFKARGTYPNINTSGQTYIYMAFASNPFKYSLAR